MTICPVELDPEENAQITIKSCSLRHINESPTSPDASCAMEQRQKVKGDGRGLADCVRDDDIPKVLSPAEVTRVEAVAGAFNTFQGYAASSYQTGRAG